MVDYDTLEIDEDTFKGVEALIQSMTPKERQQPKLLNYSRKKRIAKGAGLQMEDINKLVSLHKRATLRWLTFWSLGKGLANRM